MQVCFGFSIFNFCSIVPDIMNLDEIQNNEDLEGGYDILNDKFVMKLPSMKRDKSEVSLNSSPTQDNIDLKSIR